MARPSAFARAPSKATTAPPHGHGQRQEHQQRKARTAGAQQDAAARLDRQPHTRHAQGEQRRQARQQEEQQQGVVCGPGRAGVDHVGKWLNKKPRAWRQAVRQAGGRPARLHETLQIHRVLSTGSKAWVPAE